MKIFRYKNIIPAVALAVASMGMTSCVGDLDVDNINPQQVSTPDYDAVLNKVYANMVLTGQTGPAGNGDLDDIDEGTSSMIRQLWNANELTTDEAECIWGDAGIPEFNHNSWSDNHPMMKALYYRLYFGITLANYYLDQTAGSTEAGISTKRAEARFMRALYYSYLMDLYGNVPFTTKTSTESAPQASRSAIFRFVQDELLEVSDEKSGSTEVLADAKVYNGNEDGYGRANKAAAWLLLARNYLNSGVYTGTEKNDSAKIYAGKVIDSPYKLSTQPTGSYTGYQKLFMGDNDTNGAQNEIILPAIHDGEKTQTWGGCLFLVASTTDGDILKDYPTGTSENWGGNHARKQFVQKFFPSSEPAAGTPTTVSAEANDDRALFYTKGHTESISKETDFKSGFAYVKFLNRHSDGTNPKNSQFVDVDFPMMRVAEAYLTYAEADARMNGNKCTADGLAKVNALRERAHAAKLSVCTLDNLCDEWSREFAYEGRRRMDLIRFGKFGGQSDYVWEWMGGTKNGTPFDKHFNIFPIPNSDINANTTGLKQNPGY